MPEVDWTSQALEDLQELAPTVAQAILEVASLCMHAPGEILDADPDEGSGMSQYGTRLYWRRCLTRDERLRLNEQERSSTEQASLAAEEDDTDQPRNYVLLYRDRSLQEVILRQGRGLVVLRVLHLRRLGFYVQQQIKL